MVYYLCNIRNIISNNSFELCGISDHIIKQLIQLHEIFTYNLDCDKGYKFSDIGWHSLLQQYLPYQLQLQTTISRDYNCTAVFV